MSAFRSYTLAGCLCLWALGVPFTRAAEPDRADVARRGKAATAFVDNRAGSSAGSAFCVHPSGLFVTNAHVVRGAETVTLVLNAGLKDQKASTARVLRSDKAADLALLQIDGGADLPTLPLGSAEKLAELDDLIVCGFPFGQQLAAEQTAYPAVSVNQGRVTALRQKDGELHRIQLDADLNPGNSGGPVLDAGGKVVGVAVSSIPGARVNFAIAVGEVRRFLVKPVLLLRSPTIDGTAVNRALPFEVRVAAALPLPGAVEVELLLKDASGKESVRKLTAGAAGVFRGEAVAVPGPEDGPLRVTATYADGSVVGLVADGKFSLGGTSRPLAELRTLWPGEKARALLRDGKTVEGPLTGLEAVVLQLGGGTSVTVNLQRAREVRVGRPPATGLAVATAVVRAGGREIARQRALLYDEEGLEKSYLADRTETEYRQGPWALGKGTCGDPKTTPILVNGLRSLHGLGTHPPAEVRYRLERGCRVFRTAVALDDSNGGKRTGDVVFEVLADGRVVWESPPINGKGEVERCELDVTGVETLELRVRVADRPIGAHAVWVEPHLLVDRNAEPVKPAERK